MCTVTVLPEGLLAEARRGEGLRLRVSCNRDELLTRAPALPPRVWQAGSRCAVMPVDPESGGTWIGANDAGLVCALLNLHDGSPTARATVSRGTIVPALLRCENVVSAVDRVRSLQVDRYRPFRLLLIGRGELAECWTGGAGLAHRHESIQGPIMRTSSGLGDTLVAAPRHALFRQFVERASDPVAAADLFHLHRWRGREALSVRMRRPDARTVSHTTVEVRGDSVRVTYRAAGAPHAVSASVPA